MFCVPCQATRRVLAEVARLVPEVRIDELDVVAQADRGHAEGIRSTPTILLRADGREVFRAEGVPTVSQVLQHVARALDDPGGRGPSGRSRPA